LEKINRKLKAKTVKNFNKMAYAKLSQRKNSKGERIYFVRYYLTGQSNRQRKFTIGNVSPHRAKEICERVRAMVIQGVDPQDFFAEQSEKTKEVPKLKLSEFNEAYIKHCKISNSRNTIEIKHQAFKKLLRYFGNCVVETITPEMLEAWMTNLKISKTTVNIYLRVIRAMFNWGYKRGMISVNPFSNAGVKQFKVPDSDPEDYFSLEAVELILKTLKGEDKMMWRVVFLALETGGRIAELLALKGSNIDLENARVLFRGSSTKSGLRRFVPLRDSAVEELKTWGIEKDKKVFPWQYTSNVSKIFRELLRELDLWKTDSGARSFHTLRHTYASHLLMSGVNIFVVSRWLGHSSVNVTEKHYGHLIPNTVEVKLPWKV